MNKKLLEFALVTITVAILAAPVMAAPATKIEDVTLEGSIVQVADGPPRVVDHYIIHNSGTSTGTVTLTIPGHPLPEGEWYSEWTVMGKNSLYPAPNPESEASIASKVVLTFTGVGTTGTFEGMDHRKIIGGSYFEDRMVLHGTGDFQGQTLKLSFEGTPPIIQEGYLIMPK